MDSKKAYVLSIIIKNNRLYYYKQYIKYAVNRGYKIYNFIDFYNNKDCSEKKIILRHDVDNNTKATRKMFEVERDMGVNSTYYFRHSTIDRPLINDMLNAGFEVGYHYETIANYAKKYNISNKSQIDFDVVKKMFIEEINDFETLIDHKVKSCASHGDIKNIELQISNNQIFEIFGNINNIVEAYNSKLYDEYIDYHIMDSPITTNCGFAYNNVNLMNGVDKEKRCIVFLAHPDHWYLSINRRFREAAKVALGRASYKTDREFKRTF